MIQINSQVFVFIVIIFLNGGEGGIRTHGGLAPTPVFETGAIDHSATSPCLWS